MRKAKPLFRAEPADNSSVIEMSRYASIKRNHETTVGMILNTKLMNPVKDVHVTNKAVTKCTAAGMACAKR